MCSGISGYRYFFSKIYVLFFGVNVVLVPVFFSLSSLLEMVLFMEAMLIGLVTMVEKEKMIF